MNLDLKCGSMSFADSLLSVIAPVLGLKTIPYLLDTNGTHTGITYAHLKAPYLCDYMGYVRYVGLVWETAKLTGDYLLSLHEK